MDESALTGESLGVEKDEEAIEGEVPLGDRKNMVFSGSFVTYGRGSFIVTDIGMQTEMGKIAQLLKTTSEKKTPLQINLDKFGQKLSILILVFCGLLFGINVLQGASVGDSFMFAIALAVAAIPEALSSIVTIVLSFGTQKMAKRRRNYKKTAGGGRSGKRICHLFGQDGHADAEQNDGGILLYRGQCDSGRRHRRECARTETDAPVQYSLQRLHQY